MSGAPDTLSPFACSILPQLHARGGLAPKFLEGLGPANFTGTATLPALDKDYVVCIQDPAANPLCPTGRRLAARAKGHAKPRNPHHFEIFEY